MESVQQFCAENGPFDGILGFSQGASMVHLLLSMQSRGQISTSFKFAILFSGFISLSSVHRDLVSPSVSIPSFHVSGEGDNIVFHARSLELKDLFEKALFESHPGGHFVPSVSTFKGALVKFFEGQIVA